MQQIRTKKELLELKKRLGVRQDWHEPDEQELTLVFGGGDFDNAMNDHTESNIMLCRDGKGIACINIAMLLAWATGYED
jgi:hypothetical protein